MFGKGKGIKEIWYLCAVKYNKINIYFRARVDETRQEVKRFFRDDGCKAG